MEEISKQVGKRIQALRVRKGFSQEGLAVKSGLHRSHLGEIERGKSNITLKTLEKIGAALNSPVIELFRGKRKNSQEEAGTKHR